MGVLCVFLGAAAIQQRNARIQSKCSHYPTEPEPGSNKGVSNLQEEGGGREKGLTEHNPIPTLLAGIQDNRKIAKRHPLKARLRRQRKPATRRSNERLIKFDAHRGRNVNSKGGQDEENVCFYYLLTRFTRPAVDKVVTWRALPRWMLPSDPTLSPRHLLLVTANQHWEIKDVYALAQIYLADFVHFRFTYLLQCCAEWPEACSC